ncbi:MAG TPA: helix-turn-helix domain-containing protein [Candidatus Saccharimonadales bacterium]|nr:helix-turn-helix domain-containing protein [Candidatus Saccharimonadales bacterium]
MVRLEQLLKDARIRRKLTLEEAAIATKIKPQFLRAIENGAYNELPSPAYAKGFVRNYAEFLGLPNVQTSALFKRDFDEKRAVKVLPEGMAKTRDFPLKRVNIRRLFIGGIIFAVLAVFFLFQARDMFFAPSVSIKTPKNGSIVSQDVKVTGTTDSNAIITINDDPVFVQTNGEFVKTLTLFPGEASITVKAKNRSGRENIQKVNITVK